MPAAAMGASAGSMRSLAAAAICGNMCTVVSGQASQAGSGALGAASAARGVARGHPLLLELAQVKTAKAGR
jgi:hypothetical protein